MKVRTISQLQTQTTVEPNSLMEVSVPDSSGTGLYLSKNMKLATLRDNIYGDLSGHLVSDYGLKHANGTRLSLSGQANTISNIRDGNVRFNGLKEFTQYPYISSDYPSVFSRYGGREEYIIPNVGHVQWMIKERNPVCVSTTSSYIADGCPFRNSNDAVLSDDTQIRYTNSSGIVEDKFYVWKIADNGTDSSATKWDAQSGVHSHFQQIRTTGNLVVWGWLSDRGVVAPENAWVGIFGLMKYEGGPTDMVWTPLQIQPWIKGVNSSQLQYVGFNVPVKEGLQIKIKTGFNVGGATGGNYQTVRSITFRDGYIPNAFFGYVITNS